MGPMPYISVYATSRAFVFSSDRAIGELGRLQNVVPVRLDVTQAESVDAAVPTYAGCPTPSMRWLTTPARSSRGRGWTLHRRQ